MSADLSQRAPYPGLRAFRREETDLFFGREDCTNAMVDRLAATRFLAVLGSSGTGKSSLVKTGLLDALELGLMAKAGSRWKIVDFRPGGAPLKNLARRLLETAHDEEAPQLAPQDVDLLRAFLARGPRAVIEWCRSGHLPKGGNLLLLVDQFEELFRYQDYAGREEAEAFVALLMESAHEADVPIYVTITMRSEYLGACALIEGLSDAINAGMFLTPRMTREHCREAIVGPAEVCGIDIEPALVNRLLNDLANFAPWDEHDVSDQLDRLMRRADQLPLLQYTLNRMWTRARERAPNARVRLTVDDYLAIEGLSGALNAHANQIFQDLGKARAQTAEWVFRALTAGSTIADAVRRPTRLDELIAACGGDEAGVRAVVDAFRAPGVNFLQPEFDPNQPVLALDTYIDISHESLIRQWKKLSEWLEAEGRAAQQWRRLVDRYGTGEMLRGRELANLVAWRTETKPNAAWAKRYGGDYQAAIAFLDKSYRAQNRKRVAVLASTVAAFVVVAGFGVDATLQRNKIASQSRELEKQLKRAEDERTRAEANKRQVVELLESVIFNIAVPLSTSDRGSAMTTLVARRASDTAQTADARSTNPPLEGGAEESEPQESVDRPTSAGPETRVTPAVATASMAVDTTRRLVSSDPDDTELRRLLVVSLNVYGEVRLQAKEFDSAQQLFREGLDLVRQMLLVSPDVRLWKDDLAVSLVGMARVHIRRDQHALARPFLEEAVAVERDLAEGYPPDRLLHNLQIHLAELGDLYLRLGDRPAARNSFEDRLEVRRRRLAMAPNDQQRMSDVSIALDRVGQLMREMGDLDGSRLYFIDALKIDRTLVARAPGRRAWHENLVFSLTRIGDLDRQVGRLGDALRNYEEALGFQRKLAANTALVGAQQSLASLLQKVGDIKRRQKQLAAAIGAHREELDIRRRLLVREPNNLTAQRNLSSALDYLGNALRENNDNAGARKAFAEQLELDRRIAKTHPDDVTGQTDLAWSLNRLGDLERDTQKPSEAVRYYEEAVAIQRRLLARDAESLVRIRALASIVSKLGSVRTSLKEHDAALKLHQEELELRRRAFKRASSDNDVLRDVSLALDRVGNVLREMGDLRGALKYFQEELEVDRSFVARAPDNLTALSDLQWTLNKLSDFVRQRLGDRTAARRYLEEMIGIDRRLIQRQPTNKDRHRRLRDDLIKLANLLIEIEDRAGARNAYVEIAAASERWLSVARDSFMKTSSASDRTDLQQAYGDAGWYAVLAGRYREAVAHIEASMAMDSDTPWNAVNLAHAYLFLGRYEDAIKLYQSVRNRPRGSDGKRTYADEIKDDFGIFRRLAIATADVDRAERELGL